MRRNADTVAQHAWSVRAEAEKRMLEGNAVSLLTTEYYRNDRVYKTGYHGPGSYQPQFT